MNHNDQKPKGAWKQTLLTIVGSVLCVLLAPILVINLTLIAKSYLSSSEVPSISGIFPMIVLTDSMQPEINGGDLIIGHTIDAADVKVGDVISFFDPAGNGTSVVTHRVTQVLDEGGELSFRTRGDNNNAEDQFAVPADRLIGIYQRRIPGAGHLAMFMQTTAGFVICVIVPLVLFAGYDLLRRRKYERSRQAQTDALMAELNALKAERSQPHEAPEANKAGGAG